MPACQPCTCHTPLPTGPSTMRCPVHTCTTTLHALPLASSNAGPGSQADCHRARHGDTACRRPIQPGTTLTQMHTSTKTHNATRRQTRHASQSISDAHVPPCFFLDAAGLPPQNACPTPSQVTQPASTATACHLSKCCCFGLRNAPIYANGLPSSTAAGGGAAATQPEGGVPGAAMPHCCWWPHCCCCCAWG